MVPRKLHLFAYLLLLNLALITTAVALHEAGHLAFGSLAGCTGGKIVLADLEQEWAGPYTEMNCPPGTAKALLGLSGFPFVILFALIFFLLGPSPLRGFGFVLLGFSLVLGSLDILLAFPGAPQLFFTATGALFFGIAELRLVSDYFRGLPPAWEAEERDALGGN